MAADGSGTTSQTSRVSDLIRAWPEVSKVRADCGVGAALAITGRQFMHLHTDDEAELRLTAPVVDRLGPALATASQVTIQRGHDWITVRIDTELEVDLVVTLASVAIKANLTGPVHRDGRPCSAAPGHIPPERLAKLITAGPGGSPMPLAQFPLLPRDRPDVERSG